jgi:hypothetical protein
MIWDLVTRAIAALKAKPTVHVHAPGVEIHDRRAHAAQTHHGYDTRERDIERVTGICLHQAAADLGENPKRYDTMGAHVGVSRGGLIIWEHDWTRWVCAANGWNNGTVSIEVSGRYYGVVGVERTYWRNPKKPLPPQRLTPEAAEATKAAVRWIVADVAARGGRIGVIVTHRQSSADRPGDPGQEIYQQVAIPIAEELGLSLAGDVVLGDGRPVPREWDARSGHRY